MTRYVGVILAIGLIILLAAPILFIQLELLKPGIQAAPIDDAVKNWRAARKLHVTYGALVLSAAAFGVALLALVRSRTSGLRRLAISLTALVLCSLLLAFLTLRISSQVAIEAPLEMNLATLLLGLCAATTILAKARRAEILVLAALAVMAWMWGAGILMVEANAGEAIPDTWYTVGRAHALGLSLIMSTLAICTAYAAIAQRRHSIALSVAVIIAICISGVWMTLRHLGLGLNGMPSAYIDYAYSFAGAHLSAGLAGLAGLSLLLISVANAIRLLFFGKAAPDAVDSF